MATVTKKANDARKNKDKQVEGRVTGFKAEHHVAVIGLPGSFMHAKYGNEPVVLHRFQAERLAAKGKVEIDESVTLVDSPSTHSTQDIKK